MVKKRKIPIRQCVATGERFPKKDMFRIVRTADGFVEIDASGKTRGRGAYLKKSEAAIQKAKVRKILDKHLEICVPEHIYDNLIKLLRGEDAE